MSDYTWAIRIDPTLAVAWSDRGLAWDLKGEYGRAIDDLDEAIRLDPQSSKAWNNRGLTWVHMGEPDKALSDRLGPCWASNRSPSARPCPYVFVTIDDVWNRFTPR
jgi:tetratricopeptide (TPR) repeat protein